MKVRSSRAWFVVVIVFGSLLPTHISSPQTLTPPLAPLDVPSKFDLDAKAAVRLRPVLNARSSIAGRRQATGRSTLDQMVVILPKQKGREPVWELRITRDEPWNAFASPDGTIYVGSSLSELAGSSAGLWAAILSHEMIHVMRRDWARRYLYEKGLRDGSGMLTLGDSASGSTSWMDARAACEALARFCRQMEVDADAAGLMLMAHAGYHPDFAIALHHLLNAQTGTASPSSTAMHPRWETRDQQLKHAYAAAGLEFDRLWPERPASPGGNPPVVVFQEEPRIKTVASHQWEVRVVMSCHNLAGAVEVVLRNRSAATDAIAQPNESRPDELRQLTGCTSEKTFITFDLASLTPARSVPLIADIYVLSAEGAVLSRAEVSGFRR